MTEYKCGSAESCKYGYMCRPSYDIGGCCHYKNKEPQTNEEWRKTCSKEDFAEAMTKVVLDLVAWNNDPKPSEVRNVLKMWLKQPHREENEK